MTGAARIMQILARYQRHGVQILRVDHQTNKARIVGLVNSLADGEFVHNYCDVAKFAFCDWMGNDFNARLITVHDLDGSNNSAVIHVSVSL